MDPERFPACRELLSSLSAERVLAELRGFLSSPKPGNLAADFAPVLAQVLPPLTTSALRRASLGLDGAPAEFALRMALLCRPIGVPEAEALADALRFDHKAKKRFLAFLEALKSPSPRNRGELLPLLKHLGREDGDLLAMLPGNRGFASLLAAAKALSRKDRKPL